MSASAGKGTQVGSIWYAVTLDTKALIDGQREVDRELKRTSGSLDQFGAKLNQVTQAIKAFAAAAYLIAQSDAYTKLNAQLKLATDTSQQFATAQGDVKRIALESQTAIGGVGTLYARVSQATKELGVSQGQVADITRTVALALKVSGAGAAESASATLQLSQAFAAGALRGEEFNSVSEAAPRLMKALADGIGVPVGQLRGMAEQGKLTSDVLAGALPKALKDLEVEAKSIQTIGGAFENLRTELTLFIGEQTSASGAAKLVADSITTLASNIDTLAAAALGFVAAKLARTMLDLSVQSALATKTLMDQVAAQQAGRAAAISETAAKIAQIQAAQAGLVIAREEQVAKLAATNATLAQAAAQANAARSAGAMSFALALLREAEATTTAAMLTRAAVVKELAVLGQQQVGVTAAMTAAQTAQTAAMAASGTAATLASRALGLLGGPIGAITTALGLGITAWSLWGGAARDAELQVSGAVRKSTREIVDDLEKQNKKLRERIALAKQMGVEIAKGPTEQAERLAELQSQIDSVKAGNGLDGKPEPLESARHVILQNLLKDYVAIAGEIKDNIGLSKELEAVGTSSKLSQWMLKYAKDTEKATEEIAKAKKELGSAFTPELEQRIKQKFMPDKKPAKDSFDQLGYLAGLEAKVASPYEQINIAEREELRKHGELVKESKIKDAAAAAEGVRLIEENAARQRLDLGLKAAEERRAQIEQEGLKEIELEKKLAEERKRGRNFAEDAIAGDDPVARLELRLQRELELNSYYASLEGANAQKHAAARLALERDTAAQIAEIKQRERDLELDRQAQSQSMAIASAQSAAGTMLDVLASAGKERTALGKALFLAERALAVATIIVNTEKGASVATGMGPFGIPMAALIRATGYASAGLVAGMAVADTFGGGRRYGGPVAAGSMYRVNETGQPEMFTARNGNQYMLPTKDGNVTAANKVGGKPGVVQNNYFQIASGVTRGELMSLVPQLKAQIKAELQASARRPGFEG
jgi:tape measure domain-containing protein